MSDDAHLRSVILRYHALTWRSLRRFGVPESRVDDAVSRVFDVVARRLGDIEPTKEQAFIVKVCVRVAHRVRASEAQRARSFEPITAELVAFDGPSPEALFEQKEARALVDEALDALDDELRTVFVLHEIEQMTMAEIAEVLALAPGTIASRLRRAREKFESAALRLRSRWERMGGKP